MSKSSIDRRSLIAGTVAALPAIATAAAAAPAVTDDPIFATVAACKAAWTELQAGCDAVEAAALKQVGIEAAEARVSAALTRECALLRAACYAVPTTLAGLSAWVALMVERVWCCEGGELGGDDGERATAASYATLQTALVRLAG